jgi:acetyl-CoA carboxylase biotin carboxyl carrier protein
MSKAPKNVGVDAELVRQLAELLDETGLSEIEYGRDDWHIRVSRGGGGPVVHSVAAPVAGAAPAPAEDAADDDLSAHPGVVASPMVGVVYTSADPDSPPYVKVGDQVGEGDTLLLIEAMKVFNPIRAPKAGKVVRILVNGGSPVEFGEPLIIIE